MRFWPLLILFLLPSCFSFEIDKKKVIIDSVEVIMQNKNPTLFMIKQRLDSNFDISGPQKDKKYQLILSLSSSFEEQNSGSDAFSAIFVINIVVQFTLKQIIDGKILDSGSISDKNIYISSRSKLLSEYMNEKQVTQNIAESIADKIFEKMQTSGKIL